MQQAEIVELFGPMLRQGTQRRRVTDYVAVLLLALILAVWGYSIWRNSQIPKIESLTLVPGSVAVIGPDARVAADGALRFCPGDLFIVRYQLDIEGEGAIYADDAVSYQGQTVKFSTGWRDLVQTGRRTYENPPWRIPSEPELPINGQRRWAAGMYTRTVSVAASNIYISRYVPPATFTVNFEIAQDCP